MGMAIFLESLSDIGLGDSILCMLFFLLQQCNFYIIKIDLESFLQVESIVLSIISMLSSPNDESPANVEAAVSNLIYEFLFVGPP